MRFWEDFAPGEETVHGSHRITEAEILEFARNFDPQPIHTDPVAAANGPFGGLIASGWHTAALFAKIWVPSALAGNENMWSPGLEELRWLVPVRPGDTLTARSRIVETWPSEQHPSRGTVVGDYELVNQRDEVVLRMRGRGQIDRRPTPEARGSAPPG